MGILLFSPPEVNFQMAYMEDLMNSLKCEICKCILSVITHSKGPACL